MANETGLWEVRIEWHHAPNVTWPQFSYAQRQTKQEADAEATRAISFGSTEADLCAIATSVRGPSEADWKEVARRQLAVPAMESCDGSNADRRKSA